MNAHPRHSRALAVSLTRSASQQADFTIRLLADRDRVADAYRAYGYFRWVDDVIDADQGPPAQRIVFVERQQTLLEAFYRGESCGELCAQEHLLHDLVHGDTEPSSGLQSYLRNMMAVMRFDAHRRGQVIASAELSDYTHKLAVAVTEAMHHFVGHGSPAPQTEARYLAVAGAHVTHMLRDAIEDCQAGYYNVPGEYLQAHGILPWAVESDAYRDWVVQRVQLARTWLAAGRDYMAQIASLRCRLAGYAYVARFEWMLRTIERDGYRLRPSYPERKSPPAAAWMAWFTLRHGFRLPRLTPGLQAQAPAPHGVRPR